MLTFGSGTGGGSGSGGSSLSLSSKLLFGLSLGSSAWLVVVTSVNSGAVASAFCTACSGGDLGLTQAGPNPVAHIQVAH